MKNYNGSQPSSTLPEHHSAIKSPPNNLRSALKNAFVAEDNFSMHDLKHEQKRALGHMEKLKSEHNTLKSSMKMVIEQKTEPAPEEENYPSQRNRNSNNVKKSSRGLEQRLIEFEEENQGLKSQLDTAMIRIAKLHLENQALKEKNINNDFQNGNKELRNELKAFQNETKALNIRIQELEEDNIKLLQKTERHRSQLSQKPSQTLVRYVNYVSKLVLSMPHSSFSRTCFEERFPKDMNTIEVLESGDFEQVLLKSFKYITDLLINLNSMNIDEATPQGLDSVNNTNLHLTGILSPKIMSPRSARGGIENFFKKGQPMQEDYEIPTENLEHLSILKNQKGEESAISARFREVKKSYEVDLLKSPGQKIMGRAEEYSNGLKKAHSRHSSSIGLTGRQEETTEDGREMPRLKKKNTYDWENSPYLPARNEEENLISHRKKATETKYAEKEPTDQHLNHRERLAVEEKTYDKRSEKHVKESRLSRVYGKEREIKEYKTLRADKEAFEGQYRSKYAKSKQLSSSRQEEEPLKTSREQREAKTPKKNGRTEQAKFSTENVMTKSHTKETTRESPTRYLEESDDSDREVNNGYREEQARYKNQNMVSPSRSIVEFRSGLVSRDQEILEELHESGETNEENVDARKKQEMWDRKREQLVRLSRKPSGIQNSGEGESKGKDYSTFRVSFGRTESKVMRSLSPESKALAGIMDVPTKKRAEYVGTNYDVITGGERKQKTPTSARVSAGKSIKFVLDEGNTKQLSTQRSKDFSKSCLTETEYEATPRKKEIKS